MTLFFFVVFYVLVGWCAAAIANLYGCPDDKVVATGFLWPVMLLLTIIRGARKL